MAKLQALQRLRLTWIEYDSSKKIIAVKLIVTEPKDGLHYFELNAYREWWCTFSRVPLPHNMHSMR